MTVPSIPVDGDLFAGTRYDIIGEGPVVVLAHDLCLDRTWWSSALVDDLTRDHRVIRFDMLGHGWSAKPPGSYFLQSFLEQLERLLAHLAIDTCHLVGDGAGSLLALHFAASSRVPRAVLGFNCPYSRPVFDWPVPEEVRSRANENAIEQAFENSVRDWISPGYLQSHPEIMEKVRSMLRQCDIFGYEESYRLLLQPGTFTNSTAAKISCPVTVINGLDDPCCSIDEGKNLFAPIPTANLFGVQGVGHINSFEHTRQLADIVREFVANDSLQMSSVEATANWHGKGSL